MSRPCVDVVILTWNDGEKLAEAVQSALGSEGVDVHVTVVDNGSTPPAKLVPDGRVTLLRNEVNLGVACGRNQGLAATGRPLVCLLDSDAKLHPSGLTCLALPMLEDRSIGLTVPVFTGQSPEASAGRAPGLARKLGRILNFCDDYMKVSRREGDPWWDVDFGIGACQVFRRVASEQVGHLDESFFYGPEDVDFCLRLKAAGWRIVQVRGALCDHPPRRRFRRILTKRGLDHAAAVARYLWRYRKHGRPATDHG